MWLFFAAFFLCVAYLASSKTMHQAHAYTANDFVITIKSNNAGTSSATQFTIPTTGAGYNYSVDCNDDGTNEATGQTGNYCQATIFCNNLSLLFSRLMA